MERILIRLPNWVGDVVMATPALRAIARSFPRARVTVAGKASALHVVRHLPYHADTVRVEPKGLAGLRETVRRLRAAGPFDLAFCLPNSARSRLEARLARVPRRVGYAGGGLGFLLTDAMPTFREGRLRPIPMVDYYLRVVERVGGRSDGRRVELAISEDVRRRGEDYLALHGVGPEETLIGLNPGAAFGSSKMWLPERFAAVGDRLAERVDGRIIVLAGPGEREIAARVVAASGARKPPVNTGDVGVSLDVLKALVARCRVLVSNDTGTRHYGAALGIPTVVILGPIDPRYTAYGPPRTVVVHEPVPCWPCHLTDCPIDHRCMRRVTADRVVEAAIGVMDGPPPA